MYAERRVNHQRLFLLRVRKKPENTVTPSGRVLEVRLWSVTPPHYKYKPVELSTGFLHMEKARIKL